MLFHQAKELNTISVIHRIESVVLRMLINYKILSLLGNIRIDRYRVCPVSRSINIFPRRRNCYAPGNNCTEMTQPMRELTVIQCKML